jgi:type IV pilus assembly protein PilM
MPAQLVTGLDIGADSLKALSLRRRGTGWQVVGAGSVPLPAGASGDAEQLAAALKRLRRSQKIPLGRLVPGLSGRGTMLRYPSLPVVPPWKLEMLVAYEIEEKGASTGTGAGEIAYDYRILDLPEFEPNQFTVLLAQAQPEVVAERLRLCRAVRRQAEAVDMASLALHNLYLESPQFAPEEITLCLDIGAEQTGLCLQEGANLLYTHAIDLGGRHFTARLERLLDEPFETAEAVKIESAGILPEQGEGRPTRPAPPAADPGEDDPLRLEPDPDGERPQSSPHQGGDASSTTRARRISTALEAEAATLAAKVRTSLVYFRNQMLHGTHAQGGLGETRERIFRPQRILLSGGGSLLPGLPEALSRRMNTPVERFDVSGTFPQRKGSAEVALGDASAGRYAVAAGLALSRARPDGVGLNLLTPSEKERRRFWQRTVYVGLTGALALYLLVLGIVAGVGRARRAERTDAAWRQAVEDAEAEAKRFGEVRQTHLRLFAELRALALRERSGPDLLAGLALLRRETGREFFFTGLQTVELVSTDTAPSDTRDAARRPPLMMPGSRDEPSASETDAATDRAAGPQRVLLLEGYCVLPEHTAALSRVNDLADRLQRDEAGLFASVRQVLGEWVESPEDLAGLYTSPGAARKAAPPRAALHFRLECRLRDGEDG